VVLTRPWLLAVVAAILVAVALGAVLLLAARLTIAVLVGHPA
jgi:hypothetical protein